MSGLLERHTFEAAQSKVITVWVALFDEINWTKAYPGVRDVHHRADLAYTAAALTPEAPWRAASFVERGDIPAALEIAATAINALYYVDPIAFEPTPSREEMFTIFRKWNATGDAGSQKADAQKNGASDRGRRTAYILRHAIAAKAQTQFSNQAAAQDA